MVLDSGLRFWVVLEMKKSWVGTLKLIARIPGPFRNRTIIFSAWDIFCVQNLNILPFGRYSKTQHLRRKKQFFYIFESKFRLQYLDSIWNLNHSIIELLVKKTFWRMTNYTWFHSSLLTKYNIPFVESIKLSTLSPKCNVELKKQCWREILSVKIVNE